MSRHDTSPHLSNQALRLRERVERGERELLSLRTLPSRSIAAPAGTRVVWEIEHLDTPR